MLTVGSIFFILSAVGAVKHVRIIRGQEATPHEFPSIVATQVRFCENWCPWCSGVLLDSNTVVSAGHCMFEPDFPFRIIAGAHRLSDTANNTYVNVLQKIRHPHYGDIGRVTSSDIMVLKLASNVSETATIKYARLPPTNGQTPPIDTNCQFAGWGKTSPTSPRSNVLMKGPMMPNTTLIRNGDRTVLYATPVGSNRTSGCHGDSGSPLYCPAKFGGAPYLTGIVSGGDGSCGSRDGYVRFARVDHFVDWLRHYMAIQ